MKTNSVSQIKANLKMVKAILKQIKSVQTLKNSTNRTNIHTFSLSNDKIK